MSNQRKNDVQKSLRELEKSRVVEDLPEAEFQRILTSDREFALEWLMQRYGKYVYRIANMMLHDPDAAEDITSDVWTKVYQNISGYSFLTPLNFRSWLGTVTRNKTLDYLDRQKSYNKLLQQIGERLAEQERIRFESPEEAIIRWEKEERIRFLVNQLPTMNRILIHLRYDIEISHAFLTRKSSRSRNSGGVDEYFYRSFYDHGKWNDPTKQLIDISFHAIGAFTRYSASSLRTHFGRTLRSLRKELEKDQEWERSME